MIILDLAGEGTQVELDHTSVIEQKRGTPEEEQKAIRMIDQISSK